MQTYLERVRRRCFICDLRDGDADQNEEIILDLPLAFAFLARYPAVYGHVLVAPREHRERVVGDFSEDEYLELQRVARRVAEAVDRTIEPERLYILSLGSQAGNAHVHWHIVPCPPGLLYEDQQVNLLRVEEDGYVDVSDDEMTDLADRLRAAFS